MPDEDQGGYYREGESDIEKLDEGYSKIPILGGLYSDITGTSQAAREWDAERQRRMAERDLSPNRVQYEHAIEDDASARAGVHADPAAVQAQRNAMAGLSRLAQGRFGAIDGAARRDTARAVGQRAGASDRAHAAQMQGQGMGRSGAALGGQLRTAANAGQEAGVRSIGAEAAAQRRALGALAGYGGISTAARRHGYAESMGRASAEDERTKRNMQRRREVLSRNVNRRNSNTLDRVALQTGRADSAAAEALQSKENQGGLVSGILGALI